MTVEDFRRIALSMPGASESAHMGHPDFRVAGKIFATVCYPNEQWGMVKLTPEQQHEFTTTCPASFKPVPGGWGRQGSTSVQLETVNEQQMRAAVLSAWRAATAKKAAKQAPKKRSA
ncbi:MAG: MmcQ/YjbR family DNA-binding protein [Silvibacterium sp.]|nr:MmcQ/YjbR family DNA-binding protein [Silvibacterium sp.]